MQHFIRLQVEQTAIHIKQIPQMKCSRISVLKIFLVSVDLVIFRAFFFLKIAPEPKSEKKSRKSTYNKILALVWTVVLVNFSVIYIMPFYWIKEVQTALLKEITNRRWRETRIRHHDHEPVTLPSELHCSPDGAVWWRSKLSVWRISPCASIYTSTKRFEAFNECV